MRLDLPLHRVPILSVFTAIAVIVLASASGAQETKSTDAPETTADAATTPAADVDPKAIQEKGEAALKAGDYVAAVTAFTELINAAQSAPDPSAAQERLILGYTGRGTAMAGLREFTDALADLKHVLDSAANYVPALIARGQVYLDTNQADLALIDYQNAAKVERGNPAVQLGLGKALVTLGHSDEAVAPLTRVITADPNNAEALRYRATAYAGTFKIEKAIEDLQKSLSINPDDYEAYFTLGIVYLREERFPEAAEALRQAREHYKPKPGQEDLPYVQGYLTLASTLIEVGKAAKDEETSKNAYTKSVEVCNKLLEELSDKNPLHAQPRAAAMYTRGIGERMLNDYGAAIKSFTQALELSPDLGDAYFRRGICFHLLGEDKMAISDFEQAAHITYDDPRCNLWAGFTYAKLGDYHKALRSYGDAIAASDRYTPAYYNRGLTYFAMGEYEKAINDFNEAIRLAPTKAEYYYKRGRAHEMLGDHQKASESYATALEFDNRHAESYRHMAGVMQRLGKPELAREYQQRADQLAPKKETK